LAKDLVLLLKDVKSLPANFAAGDHGKRNKGLQEPHAEAAAELLRRLLAERTEL
jgi:hypothetical protein